MTHPFIFREAVPEDFSFVLNSWTRSYKQTGRVKYKNHRSVVLDLLERSYVVVAASPYDSSHILGWICYEKGLVHYIYIKTSFRRYGVASRLLEIAGFEKDSRLPVSHVTYAEEFFPNFSITLAGETNVINPPGRGPSSGCCVRREKNAQFLEGE